MVIKNVNLCGCKNIFINCTEQSYILNDNLTTHT